MEEKKKKEEEDRKEKEEREKREREEEEEKAYLNASTEQLRAARNTQVKAVNDNGTELQRLRELAREMEQLADNARTERLEGEAAAAEDE